MAGKVEQFSELQRKNMEAAMRLAQLSIENSQRIMALQNELAKEMFQAGVENAKAQTTARDPQALMQLRTQYAQETTQRMVEAAQQVAEIGNSARAEFARLITEQLASGSQDMAESLQAFLKNLPGQTPNMMESFQQAIATANQAFDQIAKTSTAAMNSVGESVKKASAKRKLETIREEEPPDGWPRKRSAVFLGVARRRRRPAVRRRVVALARVDPAAAGRCLFLLPEGGARFQVIHDEFAGGEGIAAMRRGRTDEDNAIAGQKAADAVDDADPEQRPSPFGLGDDILQGLLGHAGVMFERHRLHGACIDVRTGGLVGAHQADETGHGADVVTPGGERGNLGAGIEISLLDADRHVSLRLPAERKPLRPHP